MTGVVEMHKIIKKMTSHFGESIGEVLIALLISSLALVMLASMISSTNSMVSKGKGKMDQYYSQNENIEKIHVSPTPSPLPTMPVSISGTNVQVTPSVPYEVNSTLGIDVYAYDIP